MRALLLAWLVPLAACSAGAESNHGVPGSGSGVARSYAVADFTKVDLRGSDNVTVKVGGAFSVRAQGDTKLLDQLVIERRGDVLRIDRKEGIDWNGETARVTVTMPAIAGASVAGSGNLDIDAVRGPSFDAALGGSGDLSIGAVAVQAASFSLAGSGDIAAAGSAGRAKFSVAGSGSIAAERLRVGDAEVSIAGSGGVSADVEGAARVSILGSGDADLGTNARCTTNRLGSGSVRCNG